MLLLSVRYVWPRLLEHVLNSDLVSVLPANYAVHQFYQTSLHPATGYLPLGYGLLLEPIFGNPGPLYPGIVVVCRIRQSPQVLLEHVNLSDLPEGVVHQPLICLRRHDQGLQVHQLIQEGHSQLLEAGRADHHLKGVWVGEIQMTAEARVELIYGQWYLDT